MRRKIFWVVLLLLSVAVFVACSDDAQNSEANGDRDIETQADGDSDLDKDDDVDKDLADLDRETDGSGSDAAEASEDKEQAADGDDECDVDFDIDVDSESELDKIDTEPEPELEIETEPEPEIEQGPAYDVHIEEFPFEGTTIVPCSDTLNKAEPRGVWGDEAGRIYFAGASDSANEVAPFWIYYSNMGTFVCDPNVTESLLDVKGRMVEGEPEVWVETANRVGRLYQGSWEFYDIPAADPVATQGLILLRDGIDVSAAGKVAVWGDWGLRFYNPATQVWTQLGFCLDSESISPMRNGYWIDEKFYMPAGCDLYEIDPANPACNVLASLSECDNSVGEFLQAAGTVDGELWLAGMSISSSASGFGMEEIFTIDVDGDAGLVPLGLDAGKCADIWNTISRPCMGSVIDSSVTLLPGSAGTPALLKVLQVSECMPFCNADYRMNIPVSVDNISCFLSDRFAFLSAQESNQCGFNMSVLTSPSRMWRSSGNGGWIVQKGVPKWGVYASGNIPRIVHIGWNEPLE